MPVIPIDISITINPALIDKIARDVDGGLARLVENWKKEFAKLMELAMLPPLRHATPVRTGRLQRSWTIKPAHGGGLNITGEFYWRFVMEDEATRLFNQLAPVIALRAIDNVLKVFERELGLTR